MVECVADGWLAETKAQLDGSHRLDREDLEDAAAWALLTLIRGVPRKSRRPEE